MNWINSAVGFVHASSIKSPSKLITGRLCGVCSGKLNRKLQYNNARPTQRPTIIITTTNAHRERNERVTMTHRNLICSIILPSCYSHRCRCRLLIVVLIIVRLNSPVCSNRSVCVFLLWIQLTHCWIFIRLNAHRSVWVCVPFIFIITVLSALAPHREYRLCMSILSVFNSKLIW